MNLLEHWVLTWGMIGLVTIATHWMIKLYIERQATGGGTVPFTTTDFPSIDSNEGEDDG